MKSKAFVQSEDRFLIVDSEKCAKCGKRKLIYDGCQCHTEDAKWHLLRDKVQTYHDTMMSMFNRINAGKDIYYEGLIRGQITAYEKVMELMKELEK